LSPREEAGTPTASTSGASSSARRWPRKFFRGDSDGPGDIQPQHPQVPEAGRRQLAARDRAGGAESAAAEKDLRQRNAGREDDPGAAAARSQGALRRRDQAKIGR